MPSTTNKEGTAIDYLDEDDPIPGQLFYCISFLSPEGIRNCTTRGVKIRGVYSSYEQACDRCKELQEKDGDFDVHVGEMGKWLAWDPDPNSAKDQVYQEKELNDLMKGYKENLSKATKMQEQRKGDMIKNAATEEKSKKGEVQDRLRKKLAKREAEKKLGNIAQRKMDGIMPKNIEKNKNKKNNVGGDELNSKDELTKKEKERLTNKQNDINSLEQNLGSIDDKLSQIQALYKKLNKKESQAKNDAPATSV